ncbi:MAG: coenzyme F420 hydrogenase/dehydrogenase beta subunit N-terminal domain-containing protein, partial [Pseudomonadota bacterium]
MSLRDPVPRTLCTDCGVSRMADPSACGTACQFIKPDYPGLETAIHGRKRGAGDEMFFGPFETMHRARLTTPADGAQWTGITTALAADLLSRGKVDAVLTMVPDANDRWKPQPALITD